MNLLKLVIFYNGLIFFFCGVSYAQGVIGSDGQYSLKEQIGKVQIRISTDISDTKSINQIQVAGKLLNNLIERNLLKTKYIYINYMQTSFYEEKDIEDTFIGYGKGQLASKQFDTYKKKIFKTGTCNGICITYLSNEVDIHTILKDVFLAVSNIDILKKQSRELENQYMIKLSFVQDKNVLKTDRVDTSFLHDIKSCVDSIAGTKYKLCFQGEAFSIELGGISILNVNNFEYIKETKNGLLVFNSNESFYFIEGKNVSPNLHFNPRLLGNSNGIPLNKYDYLFDVNLLDFQYVQDKYLIVLTYYNYGIYESLLMLYNSKNETIINL